MAWYLFIKDFVVPGKCLLLDPSSFSLDALLSAMEHPFRRSTDFLGLADFDPENHTRGLGCIVDVRIRESPWRDGLEENQ